MKAFAVVSRKKFLVIILSLILFALILGDFYSAKASAIIRNGLTNTDRLDYISSLGLKVNSTPVTEKILIPFEFSNVYEEYSNLQLQAGFNIEIYRGKEVCKYTYTLVDDDFTIVNLLVYNGIIIGGDICDVRLNGFIRPLKKINNE